MEQVTLRIHIESPTVIAESSVAEVLTGTRDFIGGRILRGIFANAFIQSHSLGKEAHKNEDFMRFFHGKLRFVNAYKFTSVGTAIPAPLSLQKNKNSTVYKDSNAVVDFYYAMREYAESQDEFGSAKRDLLGFKGVKGFVVLSDEYCYPVHVKTAIKLHMSRSAVNERLQGSSINGNIFNYEYIQPGEVFEGFIIGPRDVLEAFLKEFPRQFKIHIGRSRKTEYGLCRMEIGNITSIPHVSVSGNSVYIRFHTPVLVRQDSLAQIITNALHSYGLQDVSFGAMYAAYEQDQYFNNSWKSRSASESAVSAGTTVELVKSTPWTDDDIHILENMLHNGIGYSLQEGFGQGRLWTPRIFTMTELPKVTAVLPSSLHETTRSIAKKVLEKQIITNARLRAAEDSKNIVNTMRSLHMSKSFISILLAELGMNRQAGITLLRRFIESVKEDKKILFQNLREFNLQHPYSHEEVKRVNLMDYIIDFDESMLVTACLSKSGQVGTYYEIPEELIKLVQLDKKAIAPIVSYEYWMYFLRHIRKA